MCVDCEGALSQK